MSEDNTYAVPPDQQVAGAGAKPFEASHLPGTTPARRPQVAKRKKGSFAQQKPKGNPKKNRGKKK